MLEFQVSMAMAICVLLLNPPTVPLHNDDGETTEEARGGSPQDHDGHELFVLMGVIAWLTMTL